MSQPSREEEDHVGEALYPVALLDWTLQEGSDPTALGPAEILEVQILCGEHLDLHHFAPGQSVDAGSDTAWFLRMAGFTLGKIPAAARHAALLIPGLLQAEEGWGCALPLPDSLLPCPGQVLLQATGNGWTARLSPHWRGFLQVEGERRPLPTHPNNEGLVELALPDRGLVAVDIGGPILILRKVPRSPRIRLAPPRMDATMPAMVAFFLFLTGMLGSGLRQLPPPQLAEQEEEQLPTTLYLQPVQAPLPEKIQEKSDHSSGPGAAASDRKSRSSGPKEAKDAGIFAALDMDHGLSDQISNSNLSAQLMQGITGLIGSKGTNRGAPSLAGRGNPFGKGPGVDGVGSVVGRPHGGPDGRADMGPRGEGGTTEMGKDAIILGRIDPSLIDAVMKRNAAVFRYCYQRELSRQPELAGKVKMRFVIGEDGSVTSAQTATSNLGSPAVESCLSGRILRLSFPKPQNGIVVVNYPFLFSAG